MTRRPLVEQAIIKHSGRAARASGAAERLFDDAALQHRLVARWLVDEGTPLSRVHAPSTPGVYALRYSGQHPAYRALDTHRIVYVGKGSSLRERLSSHVSSLRDAHDLEVGEFAAVLMPLASIVHAEVAEHLLIGAFDPMWCRTGWSGFGSRPQGAGRRNQRATAWDRHHPGRSNRTQADDPTHR